MNLTKLLPLHNLKLKDREDIIKWLVNREDTASPYMPPIPAYKTSRMNWKESVWHIFSKEFVVYSFKSFAP